MVVSVSRRAFIVTASASGLVGFGQAEIPPPPRRHGSKTRGPEDRNPPTGITKMIETSDGEVSTTYILVHRYNFLHEEILLSIHRSL